MKATDSSATPPARRRRAGRPPGSRSGETRTRELILTAARALFAERTYAATTIRAVAAEAGVNPALVHHFFGSKRELFAASIQLPAQLTGQVPLLIAGETEHLGERLARLFLHVWENPATGPQVRAMIRSAFSDDEAAATLRDVLTTRVLTPLSAALPHAPAPLRLSLAASQLVGLAATRHILRIGPLVDTETEQLVAWVGPTIQRYLTADLTPPTSTTP
ncbi:MAG: TetR family transcriptional regulator [Kitasatospora sp.]|jgi:AcrR family transcriptional regulator|nr:TetR family transcriptional regulator [Kitasatospora sp.]